GGCGLLRPRRRVPVLALEGQLDRGRHLGDPAQHRRRASARPASGGPAGQGQAMEGPAAVSQHADAEAVPAAERAGQPAGGGLTRLPDMTYTEQETELRAAVRSVLDDRAAHSDVLARTESPQTYDTGLWRTLAAEVGCAGLLIPESLGGAGASFREAAVVAEEVGRSVAPVPFLGSAVLATVALLKGAQDGAESDQAGQVLTDLAAGRATAALAVPFAAVPGARIKRAVRGGAGGGG